MQGGTKDTIAQKACIQTKNNQSLNDQPSTNFPITVSARQGELRRHWRAGHAPAHARLWHLHNGLPPRTPARHLQLVPLALRALPLHAGRLEEGQELLGEQDALRDRLGHTQVHFVVDWDSVLRSSQGFESGRLLHPFQRDNGNYAARGTHYAARGLHCAARGLP